MSFSRRSDQALEADSCLRLERDIGNPYELGESLFGRYASGDGDRSIRRKGLVRQKVHARAFDLSAVAKRFESPSFKTKP